MWKLIINTYHDSVFYNAQALLQNSQINATNCGGKLIQRGPSIFQVQVVYNRYLVVTYVTTTSNLIYIYTRGRLTHLTDGQMPTVPKCTDGAAPLGGRNTAGIARLIR